MSKCDKCGKEVPANNDASLLDALLTRSCLAFAARHLLPTDTCEGSPSRAQYLENQPRDSRGYTYHPGLRPYYQEAFARMQESGYYAVADAKTILPPSNHLAWESMMEQIEPLR